SALLCRRTHSSILPVPRSSVFSLWSSPVLCPQSLVLSCTISAVSGPLLYYIRSLWSSPVLYPQSLVISCSMSAVSGHFLYYVCSPLSSLYCPQSLVIPVLSAVSGHPCAVRSLWSSPVLSAVSGHPLYCVRSLWSSLYCVRSLWSSPVLCPQSLVISCTVSAVSGHLL
ncbi:unnamed protein product, partial [Staurois parvus]